MILPSPSSPWRKSPPTVTGVRPICRLISLTYHPSQCLRAHGETVRSIP